MPKELKKIKVLTDHIKIFRYNIAVKCADLGMTVVAGCYDVNSVGALQLVDQFKNTNRVYIVPLDVTKSESVSSIYSFVKELLQKDPELGKISLFCRLRKSNFLLS